MSSENTVLDYEELEKKAGQKAARTLQRNWKTILGTATLKQSGTLLKNSHVKAQMKFGELDSLTIYTTSVGMKLNYGFEGIKSNGIAMSLKPLNNIQTLFDKSQATIEKLAQELAEIKGHEVATKIIS
ncbi:hypothetical protein [Tenacibaculum soleae]|uniref:hypothetical protein n=1 Tax=Tenacibaculum soleae TaxID=447689 RepID=UPI0026E1E9C9|nr:hypothetical protein [Tenacibaculum soleae]MDO6813834.1 hypothetical protein [Tenacibaculum soleae]